MSSFEFHDFWGDLVTVHPERMPTAIGAVPTVELRRVDGKSIRICVDQLEEVVAGLRDMARQAGGPTPIALAGAPITSEQLARAREILPHGARVTAGALNAAEFSVTERQFLSFALDLAADRIADRGDEFSDEDEAALDRFRTMTVDEP